MKAPPSPQCNMCGLSCGLTGGAEPGAPGGPDNDLTAWPGGLLNAKVEGGYSSTPGNGAGALDDCTRYEFSLCEFCLDWLFTNFKIPPHVLDVGAVDPELVFGEEVFRPAEQRVKEDDWRKHKDGFMREKTRRDEARMGEWAKRKTDGMCTRHGCMSHHYKKVCRACNYVLEQCRCMKPDKHVEYVEHCEKCPPKVEASTPTTCPFRNRLLGSKCQLAEGHEGEHCFPMDEAFFQALDDGSLIIGRPPKK